MALSHSTPQLPRTSWISSCQPQHCHTGNAKLRRTLCCNILLSAAALPYRKCQAKENIVL